MTSTLAITSCPRCPGMRFVEDEDYFDLDEYSWPYSELRQAAQK